MKRARKNTRISKKQQRQNKPHKKLRPSSVVKAILAIMLVLVAVVFVALGFGFVDESDLLAPIDRESGKINALLLGVDEDGLRTDTIMVASFDLDTAQINLMSIPRDTKLYVTNRKMTRKINEIHAMSTKEGGGKIMGPIGTAEVVTQLTGIPINYYVEFSFDAVENIFDTLGTITYDVPDVEGGGKGMNYEDPTQDLYIHLKPGVQELDGDKVLQFMRYRKGDSDFARMERQQGIIKAVVEQKLNFSLIMKLPKLFSQMKKDISTNLSSAVVSKYAQYLGELSSDKITTFQLPGESKYQSGGWYFICDVDATKTLVTDTFGFDASEISTNVEVYGEGSEAKAITNKKKTTTGTPAATKAPAKATAKPEVTKAPVKKATPEPTVTASPTKVPTETKAPSATATPKPVATKAPTPEPEDDVISLD